MTIWQVWVWDPMASSLGEYIVHSNYTSEARALRVREELAKQENPRKGQENWTSPKCWPIEVIEGEA